MNYLRFTSKGVLLFTYNEKDYPIGTVDDWVDAVEDIKSRLDDDEPLASFQCSSSIDFPEEETDDKDLIKLCYLIRSN